MTTIYEKTLPASGEKGTLTLNRNFFGIFVLNQVEQDTWNGPQVNHEIYLNDEELLQLADAIREELFGDLNQKEDTK